MSTTDQVLSEFIDAWNAGRRPRVREYLARLPTAPTATSSPTSSRPGSRSPRPPPTTSPPAPRSAPSRPSPACSTRRRGRRPVADGRPGAPRPRRALHRRPRGTPGRALLARPRRRPAHTGYLERLERGALDPTRVSRRLLDALGALLGVSGRALADAAAFSRALRPAPPAERSSEPTARPTTRSATTSNCSPSRPGTRPTADGRTRPPVHRRPRRRDVRSCSCPPSRSHARGLARKSNARRGRSALASAVTPPAV